MEICKSSNKINSRFAEINIDTFKLKDSKVSSLPKLEKKKLNRSALFNSHGSEPPDLCPEGGLCSSLQTMWGELEETVVENRWYPSHALRVEAIDIDAENGIVTVSGDADPLIILAEVRKKTKKAEILSSVGPKKKDIEIKESKKDEKSSKSDKGKKKEEPEHVFEAYVPKTTSCKDPFCKAHQSGISVKTKQPSPPVHYLPPHLGFAPPVAPPPYYPPIASHSYYPPMYPRGSYFPSWPESQQCLERPFRFDRQLPQPQFDLNMSQRPPRHAAPPYFGQHRAWG